MYYWIAILVAWACVLLLMASGVRLPKKKHQTDTIEKYMNNNPHVTDEGALVDALQGEDIQYKGVAR